MLPDELTLAAIDRHFADFICRLAGKRREPLWLAAALLSQSVGSGHVCLDLQEVAGRRLSIDGRSVLLPDLADWSAALAGEEAITVTGGVAPLVLTATGRLYLQRFWQDEEAVSSFLALAADDGAPYDPALAAHWLSQLFPPHPLQPDWQRVAAATALLGRLTVISGGPGTGKTTTVARIMTLLCLAGGVRGESIALAAPTGKAAGRLSAAINDALAALPATTADQQLPREAVTLHRLLGRTDTTHQLPFQMVIVDEASMVALPLLARLVRSLRPDARLILLGDRDQLASVEAGAVLGDLCANPGDAWFTPAGGEAIAAVTGDAVPTSAGADRFLMADRVVLLRHTYRFTASSGIGRVSRLVTAGEGGAALDILLNKECTDLHWQQLPVGRQLEAALDDLVTAGYGDYLLTDDPAAALQRFDRFRLLAAMRVGEYGVAGLNLQAERILARHRLIDPRPVWYAGRPVLVTVNDYGVRLFNGDIGLTLPDPAHDNELRVFFAGQGGQVRSIHPLRLPAHETAFALTVHKSQGSEFTEVALVLPPDDLPLLTRELVYTGLTRARETVHLFATAEVFKCAVKRQVTRSSGLRDRLWDV